MNEWRLSKEVLRAGTVEIAKAFGACAYTAAFFAYPAYNHAVETTTIEKPIAEFPAELSFYPRTTRVDLLGTGNIYIDKTRNDIGLKAKITGLPRFESGQDVIDYFSPNRFAIYSSMADSPKEAAKSYEDTLKDEALNNFLRYDLTGAGLGGAAIYGGLTLFRLRNRLRQAEGKESYDLSKVMTTGLGAIALASSLTIADYNHNEWLKSAPQPNNMVTISSLDNTSLRGARVDNPGLLSAIDQGVRYAITLKDRRDIQRQAYLDKVLPQLTQDIAALPAPRDNEKMVMLITDVHASKAAVSIAGHTIKELRSNFGEEIIDTVVNDGDFTYGVEFQRQSIFDQSKIIPNGKMVATEGNHDPRTMRKYLKEADMEVMNGVQKVKGFTYYGKADPQQTPFLGASYYPDPNYTEKELGEDAYIAITKEPVDIVGLHQPKAIESMLGVEDIYDLLATKPHLTTYTANDGVKDMPVSLVNGGHKHVQYPVQELSNSDGTWTVLNVQGSAGGANEAPTLNNWSDPDGPPVKPINIRVFYINTKYKSVTGYLDITAETTAHLQQIVRTNIGTLTGAPYDINSANSVNRPGTKIKQTN